MRYDLIIVGGGLVGAGLALALKKSQLRVALIDARLPDNNDPRLFALNYASCQFLKNIGVWPSLMSHAAPIHTVHVSYRGHFGALRLHCEEVQLSALGHVIPARFIEAELNQALMQLSSVDLYRPALLKTLTQESGLATLMLEMDGAEKVLQAPIVIGADGTESTVRKQLQMTTTVFDYQQSAIVTRTQLERSHQHIAYERFNANGAIAMLPLTGNECATIWTAGTKTIAELMLLSDEAFLQVLQTEFGYRLGRLKSIAQRHVFPLRLVRAEKAVEDGVFLLGNSAHTLHPIAAQGFNLALYEVATLVDGLVAKNDLMTISEKIQKHQALSMGLSHRLSKLFSSPSFLMNMALPLGMLGFDIATPFKRKFIEKMTGRFGSLPHLLLDNETDHQTL